MSKILTNSELPITMLKKHNENLNDYDFVLYHLYSSDQEYKEYFKNLRQTSPNRMMIFDNSAYEYFIKGEELCIDKFIEAALDLRPDVVICPDVLMDKEKTIAGTEEFMEKWNALGDETNGIEVMPVMQGKNPDEMISCAAKYTKLGLTKHLAIPFHNSFFIELSEYGNVHLENEWRTKFGHINKDMKYALGRINFMVSLYNVVRLWDHIHLLGSHNPYEKAVYGTFDWTKTKVTMDTGYPVKCAIEGYELFKEPQKPTIIIDDFLHTEFGYTTEQLIVNNVSTFHTL